MKKTKFILISFCLIFFLSSCKIWNKVFAPKYGCPTDGKNIGAERILSGDPNSLKAVKKAKKFPQ